MSKKTIQPVDLSAAVDELLAKYGEQVFDVMGDAIRYVSTNARDDLRSVNRFSSNGNPTGAYSKSWEYEQRLVHRYKQQATVFNEDHYRLTHLLESGHSKWLWGRPTGESVQGYPHIAKVNDKAQDSLIEMVSERIESL